MLKGWNSVKPDYSCKCNCISAMCVHEAVCIYIYIYICARVRVCVYVCVHVCVWAVTAVHHSSGQVLGLNEDYMQWCTYWAFSEAGLLEWMRFVIFRARSRDALPGRFLGRRCFTLCITTEVEPRIAKQYKCQRCCSCKYYRGTGVEGRKKVSLRRFLDDQKITRS